jgi:hypothetical protein
MISLRHFEQAQKSCDILSRCKKAAHGLNLRRFSND